MERSNKPAIERTYLAQKPNGEMVEVNIFDYNLGFCANPKRYIQCSDTSWGRICDLKIIKPK